MTPDRLTVSDVAQMFGVTKWTVYVWTSKRLIPFYKIGNHKVYFLKKEVEAWEKRNKVEAE